MNSVRILIFKGVIITRDIDNLLKLKKVLDKFCVAPTNTWKMRILLEAKDNKDFYDYVYNILNKLNTLTSEELNNLFLEIRNKGNYYLELFNSCNDKVYYAYKVETYFGLIEEINELSSYAYDLSNRLVKKYGNDYISDIDRKYPTFKFKEYTKYEDDDINKYLVMKLWQDSQNSYAKEVLHGSLDIDSINKSIKRKYGMLPRVEYELNKLKGLININDLTLIYIATEDKRLINMVGGKGYGLIILNLYSVIPETYLVKTDYLVKEKDLEILNKNNYYSVRSSADCEDGENSSFAGMFLTELNVPYDSLFASINRVKESVNSKRAMSYIKKKKIDKPHMAVVIQRFIEPKYSGVWIGKNKSTGVLEQVEGNGEKLVSGKITPKTIEDKDNYLYKYFIKLQKKIGSICDFEWCILGKDIVMLQCRPVTTIVKKIKRLDGIGASDGIVKGKIQLIEQVTDIDKFQEGNILLTYLTDPDWVPAILKSKGVITAFGGYLCHTAIICRELKIPCITDIGIEKLNELKELDEILIDGATGKITKSEKKI